MKVALCMTETNEYAFLKRHLPMMKSLFDGLFVSDGGSDDQSEQYIESVGGIVIRGDYGHGEDWREDEAKNAPVKAAEEAGFDWCLNLDADELMSYQDIKNMTKFMFDEHTFLILPRIEFYGDTNHYKPNSYPDLQGRAFKLGMGYRWHKQIHSYIIKEGEDGSKMTTGIVVPNSQIYHYGWALDFERRCKRYYPGQPIPDPFANPEVKTWYGVQPL